MKRLTVALDFGPATDTLVDFAVHLSRDLDMDLNLVHVHQFFAESALTPASFLEEQANLSQLQQIATKIGRETHSWVKTDYSVAYGPPEPAILRAASDSDLILLGQTLSTGIWRVVLGDVTDGVLEEAKCPVLIVPIGAQYTEPTRIALAVDDRPALSRNGRQLLGRITQRFDVTLDVFHREDDDGAGPGPGPALRPLLGDLPYTYHRERSEEAIDDFVLNAAEDVDAVWVGVIHHRRPRWKEWFSRNRSERIADVAPIPVLVFVDDAGADDTDDTEDAAPTESATPESAASESA